MFLQENTRYNPYIPMTNKTNFSSIWEALDELDYVWLNPMGYAHPIIYLPKEQVKTALKAFEQNQNIAIKKSKGLGTVIRVNINSDSYIIRFVHHLQTHGLVILPAKELMQESRRNKFGIKIPRELHLLEYHLLRDFLHGHGLKRTSFLYFKDLHPLTENDLLEAINEKYNTKYTRIGQMTSFDKKSQQNMIAGLESMPYNRYFKKLANNLRPLYFKLARQAGLF